MTEPVTTGDPDRKVQPANRRLRGDSSDVLCTPLANDPATDSLGSGAAQEQPLQSRSAAHLEQLAVTKSLWLGITSAWRWESLLPLVSVGPAAMAASLLFGRTWLHAATTGWWTTFAIVLATPEEIYGRRGQGSLLRQDIHVMWQDTWTHPFVLPELGTGAELSGIRDRLTDRYRRFDLHGHDRGFALQLAGWLAFAGGLPFAAARTRARATR